MFFRSIYVRKFIVKKPMLKKVWQSRGKGGEEAREENSRFKPTGESLKQAILLLVWKRKFKEGECTIYY